MTPPSRDLNSHRSHRVSTGLVSLLLILLSFPAGGSAAPAITFKPADVPIPGFPGTGDILGAGAAVQAQYTISGTESAGGLPSQLRKLAFYLPTNTRVHPAGFSPCSAGALEATGPSACPKNSVAGPVGRATVAAPIAGVTIFEPATVQAFAAPGGGLSFYNVGTSPIAAIIVAQGAFQAGGPGYGPELVVNIPPIKTVPEAPNASVTAIDVKVGAAIRKGRKTLYFGTNATRCPKGGFRWKTELTFESGEVSTATATTKCPKSA
jgi:hypothetical protein